MVKSRYTNMCGWVCVRNDTRSCWKRVHVDANIYAYMLRGEGGCVIIFKSSDANFFLVADFYFIVSIYIICW